MLDWDVFGRTHTAYTASFEISPGRLQELLSYFCPVTWSVLARSVLPYFRLVCLIIAAFATWLQAHFPHNFYFPRTGQATAKFMGRYG